MAIRCRHLDMASRGDAGSSARLAWLRRGVSRLAFLRFAAPSALLLAALPGLAPAAWAQEPPHQTLNDRFSAASGDKKAPMVVEAKSVLYDDKAHTVTAEGDAQIYYKGKVLEADRVIYHRDTGRVMAEGSVKLTDTDGSITHADKMELTGDFKQGFVDVLRADTKERTHMSATRSEKIDADTTVFEKGTYTACPSCAAHPDRPTIWRLRADKITHKNDEQMLYYENAWFELYGVPIAYFPYLSAADPSVTRQSGFLAPRLTYRSTTGFGVGVPYFWAIAPNMDVTLTPMYLTRQGAFGEIDFRHRLENGFYEIQASGIHQNADSAFVPEPWGSGDRTNRGEVQTQGAIWLSPFWKFGWDVARVSDKWFLNDYGMPNSTLTGNFFRETSSTIYLNGQGDRGYFDLRGFAFQGMANTDYQPQLASVTPMLDYNKTVDLKPEQTFGIGGQLEIDANFTHSNAGLASYQQIGSVQLDNQYGLHPVCVVPTTPATIANKTAGLPDYTQNSCLLRGIGGDYTSGTVQLSWQRKFIDPIGEVWTPFAFARANGNYLDYSTSGSATFGTDTIANSSQSNFLSDNRQFNGWVTPGVGIEWRYPLLARTPLGSVVIEPIAQVIARPNSQNPNTMVNLDAQSLVFDDSNLFEWNKYSGYDRFETGVRSNYGAQFTLDMNKNGYVNAMFGQSAQLAGINSYATPDAANIGLLIRPRHPIFGLRLADHLFAELQLLVRHQGAVRRRHLGPAPLRRGGERQLRSVAFRRAIRRLRAAAADRLCLPPRRPAIRHALGTHRALFRVRQHQLRSEPALLQRLSGPARAGVRHRHLRPRRRLRRRLHQADAELHQRLVGQLRFPGDLYAQPDPVADARPAHAWRPQGADRAVALGGSGWRALQRQLTSFSEPDTQRSRAGFCAGIVVRINAIRRGGFRACGTGSRWTGLRA